MTLRIALASPLAPVFPQGSLILLLNLVLPLCSHGSPGAVLVWGLLLSRGKLAL